MRSLHIAAPLAALLTLLGCADLTVVRQYSRESSQLAAYTDLTVRYRDTFAREEPYLDERTLQSELALDAQRKQSIDDLMKIHQCLTSYMDTLGRLAGDDAFSLAEEIDTVGGRIREIPDLGITADHVDAYVKVTQIIARWATASIQEKAVRSMVVEGDPQVQKLVAAMRLLVKIYARVNHDERARVLGVFDINLPYADEKKEALLNRLARAHLQAKKAEYDAAERKYAEADKALAAIA